MPHLLSQESQTPHPISITSSLTKPMKKKALRKNLKKINRTITAAEKAVTVSKTTAKSFRMSDHLTINAFIIMAFNYNLNFYNREINK